jgi:uncharacterized protein YjiS (DUF1127 family)
MRPAPLAEVASISIKRSATMSSSTIETPVARSAGLNSGSGLAVLARPIQRGIAWIGARRRLRRQINELMALDDRTLRDIGLRRGEVERAVRYGRPVDRWSERIGL